MNYYACIVTFLVFGLVESVFSLEVQCDIDENIDLAKSITKSTGIGFKVLKAAIRAKLYDATCTYVNHREDPKTWAMPFTREVYQGLFCLFTVNLRAGEISVLSLEHNSVPLPPATFKVSSAVKGLVYTEVNNIFTSENIDALLAHNNLMKQAEAWKIAKEFITETLSKDPEVEKIISGGYRSIGAVKYLFLGEIGSATKGEYLLTSVNMSMEEGEIPTQIADAPISPTVAT